MKTRLIRKFADLAAISRREKKERLSLACNRSLTGKADNAFYLYFPKNSVARLSSMEPQPGQTKAFTIMPDPILKSTLPGLPPIRVSAYLSVASCILVLQFLQIILSLLLNLLGVDGSSLVSGAN